MHLFGFGKDSHAVLEADRERLASLHADLAAVADGRLRPADLNTDAPLLDGWAIAQVAVPCLVGLSQGHPRLPGDRRPIGTSQLWLMSDDMCWARTHSRWYRLGRPAGQAGRPS